MCRVCLTVILLLLVTTACGNVRPETDAGPVVDASRNISASLYIPGGMAPNRLFFIRHFHYFSRPSPWTITSSGDSSPHTQFEAAAVYVLRSVGVSPVSAVTRLAQIPGIRTDGITPPRVHLAIAAPSGGRNPSSAAIVYIEDGPIYGGIDVAGVLDPAMTGDTPLRLLVNARVRAAALARDGNTIAYVDEHGRLFVTKSDESEAELLIDVRATLGPVDIMRVQWAGGIGGPLLVLDRGRGAGPEVRRVVEGFEMSLLRVFVDPETVREPGSDQLPFIDEVTSEIGPGEWKVPDPSRFTPGG